MIKQRLESNMHEVQLHDGQRLHLHLAPLATLGDWEQLEAKVGEHEVAANANPFQRVGYFKRLWELFGENEPAFSFLVYNDENRLVASSVFRRDREANRRLKPMVLRTYDTNFFLHAPPFTISPGCEDQVIEAIAMSAKWIGKQSQTDIMKLSRMEIETAEQYKNIFQRLGKHARISSITQAPMFSIDTDFESFLRETKNSELRYVARKIRKIEKQLNSPVKTDSYRCDELSDDEYEKIWGRYITLRSSTWQDQWESENEKVDVDANIAYHRKMFDYWRSLKLLRVYFLVVNDVDVAYSISLREPDHIWNLLIGYHSDYKKYSPGRIIFIEAARDLFQQEKPIFEMGGEVIGWKTVWANNYKEIVQFEFGLTGWKSNVWTCSRKLAGSKS